jgi:hypothetical protein
MVSGICRCLDVRKSWGDPNITKPKISLGGIATSETHVFQSPHSPSWLVKISIPYL